MSSPPPGLVYFTLRRAYWGLSLQAFMFFTYHTERVGFLCFLCICVCNVFVFWRVSLGSSGWPGTHRYLSASTSWVLGLKVCSKHHTWLVGFLKGHLLVVGTEPRAENIIYFLAPFPKHSLSWILTFWYRSCIHLLFSVLFSVCLVLSNSACFLTEVLLLPGCWT